MPGRLFSVLEAILGLGFGSGDLTFAKCTSIYSR